MRKQPMQPIYRDTLGVPRFQTNAIIEWLVESGRANLNDIRIAFEAKHCVADLEQFWQMLGYSVDGFAELSFVRRKTIRKADRRAEGV